ncbi:hypothetical protein, partial [Staphylococcus aureus]|uniref:hypothetical protein n=1 Tax=Staphylococcus aureus TaxID=1280 RepID=UPI004037363E
YISLLRSVVKPVFNLRILSCFPSFRIYRETLSRFSCAASDVVDKNIKKIIFDAFIIIVFIFFLL